MTSVIFGSLVTTMLVLNACAPDHSGSHAHSEADAVEVKTQNAAIRSLVESDLENLRTSEDPKVVAYDQAHQGLFTAIFGGNDGASVYQYLIERLHSVILPSDLEGAILQPQLKNLDLATEFREQTKRAGAKVIATNISTQLWLSGLLAGVNRVVLNLPRTGRRYNIDSMRAGLIMLGPGYRATETDNGQTTVVPSLYRQAFLVHEARHSDCTGGVTTQDLAAGRMAKTSDEFTKLFPKISCGHLHVKCPSWHAYAGLEACDADLWGAYAVQYVFAAAHASNAPPPTVDDEQARQDYINGAEMREVAIDAASRLLYITSSKDHSVNSKKLTNMELGYPEMSNGGLTQ